MLWQHVCPLLESAIPNTVLPEHVRLPSWVSVFNLAHHCMDIMSACRCTCACVCVYVCVFVWRSMSIVFLITFCHIFEPGSLTESGAQQLDCQPVRGVIWACPFLLWDYKVQASTPSVLQAPSDLAQVPMLGCTASSQSGTSLDRLTVVKRSFILKHHFLSNYFQFTLCFFSIFWWEDIL